MKPSNPSTEVCFNATEVTIAPFQASTMAQHLFSVLFLLQFPYCSSTFLAPLRNRLHHHVLDTTVSHGVLQIVPSMQSSFSLDGIPCQRVLDLGRRVFFTPLLEEGIFINT